VRPHNVGLQLGQINFHNLVEKVLGVLLHLRVGAQQVGVFAGQIRQLAALCGFQVERHAFVIGKDGSSGAQLCAHVGHRRLAGA